MDLKAICDEREIAQRLARFSRIMDGKRYDEIGDVFAEEVRFEYGVGGEQAGIAALRGLFRQFLDTCGPTQHLIGSIAIDVEGDQAVSRAYVQARHQRAGDAMGRVLDTNGEYVDRWARLAAGWRIVRRDVHWTMFTGDADILELGAASTA